MNQNQDTHNDDISNTSEHEVHPEDLQENNLNTTPGNTEQKASYVLALSIVFGCAILAAAYMFTQTSTEKPEVPTDETGVSTEIPVDIEENEQEQFPDVYNAPESSTTDTESNSIEKEFLHVIKNDSAKYDQYYKKLVSQEGVVWLEHPRPVGDLELFTISKPNHFLFKNKKFEYYQIGTVNGSPLIVLFIPYCEMGCVNSLLYFIQKDSGNYTFLKAQSSLGALDDDYIGFIFSPSVSTDDNFVLNAHQIQEEMTVAGVTFATSLGEDRFLSFGPSFFADSYYNTAEQHEGEYTEFIAETEYGPAYRGLRKLYNEDTKDLDYAVRLAGGLMLSLKYKPEFISDDRVPRIGWLDGTDNQSPYRTDGLGSCGGGGPEVMSKAIPKESLLLAGYTINQEPIYKVTDPNQPIIKRLFPDSDTREYYEYNIVTQETETFTISKSDFIEEGGVIIYIDPFGFQHVLTHTKYGPQAECAKPVVYLYPTETTDVSVSLDALVTQSDPQYDSGWDVTAYPDGTLMVHGKKYDSLFWDGYGNGTYPELHTGFVVPTDQAIPMMKEHLAQMGFNSKEISDFAEFWMPHMPEEPFTRFSWIGTVGMENLAKLSIVPKPDTLIRAFIDFEGLAEQTHIDPQIIPSYERTGFVATEWGGLLRK